MKDRLVEVIRAFFSDRHGDADCFADSSPLDLDVRLEAPRQASHGDVSSNVAMAMASKLGLKPRDLAADLAAWCNEKLEGAATAEIAGPGFLNFRFASRQVQGLLRTIIESGADYGRSDAGAGRSINLEFVSANPTGPPVIVSARAAAFGSTLARVMDFVGYKVTSEYYLNDSGVQIAALGESLRARWRERQGEPLAIPENGYHGLYLREMAAELSDEETSAWAALGEEEEVAGFALWAMSRLKSEIREQMEAFNTPFDVWFSEDGLRQSGAVGEARAFLEEQGHCYKSDGAIWFRSSDFGDDKDRVIVKADGQGTYFLADVAYALDKYRRGYERAIYILGPDHHGYVARLKAIAEAIGAGGDWLEVLLLQWVTLIEDGEAVSMSKRAGEFVTMADLVSDVGVDVARTFFLARRCESHLDFDLNLAREQSSKSPVFYAQYATARIAGLLRKASAEGVDLPDLAAVNLSRLEAEEELALIKGLGRFPATLASLAEAREPNRLFQYLNDVATLFHRFYHEHKIVSDDPDLSHARLALCLATRQVMSNGLTLMGVSAPERM